MAQIAPSILAADFARMGEEVRAAKDAGVKMLHIDVMDGHFVPNLTMGPDMVGAIKKSVDLFLDVFIPASVETDIFAELFCLAAYRAALSERRTYHTVIRTVFHSMFIAVLIASCYEKGEY